MGFIIFIILFFGIVLFNLIRIITFGKGFIKPDFRRVDEEYSKRIGFTSYWNTTFGKIVYYVMLIGLLSLITTIIYGLMN